ncbi:MAG TPA: hypothetical protein DCM38_01435 [Gammaproteobacteria bacterium]|nr:hypothetical protein [Gammaproteobacteria bacterium]
MANNIAYNLLIFKLNNNKTRFINQKKCLTHFHCFKRFLGLTIEYKPFFQAIHLKSSRFKI